jgi:signal transduction histidine kinase
MHEIVASLRADVDAHDGIATRTRPTRDGTLVIALGRTLSGRYAWAALRVPEQSPLQPWRFGIIVLAVATLLLVVATLQTLFAFRRGAASLQGSLEALTTSLDAPVARPDIRELGDVASGIARLATALSHAQAERERLTRELVERERLASLGRVAAGVAHEVRNPLASMKLRVDLAERVPGVPASVAQDLAEVSGEIQRLDRLVTDLLAITGRRLGKRTETDLRALVQKRVDLLAPWAAENGVRVVVEGAADAQIDPDALGRAVDNLLRNAVQFSPREATVAVSVAARNEDAIIEVADRGPGVPSDQVSKLFEPFFTTRAEGTGLGLALSRSIAAAHGGTLEYARHGDETRFVISIPRHAPPSANGSSNA